MITLDARGISCPEPLLMLKNALKTDNKLIFLVDSKNAFTNCEDYARKQGFTVETEQENDVYKMQITGKI